MINSFHWCLLHVGWLCPNFGQWPNWYCRNYVMKNSRTIEITDFILILTFLLSMYVFHWIIDIAKWWSSSNYMLTWGVNHWIETPEIWIPNYYFQLMTPEIWLPKNNSRFTALTHISLQSHCTHWTKTSPKNNKCSDYLLIVPFYEWNKFNKYKKKLYNKNVVRPNSPRRSNSSLMTWWLNRLNNKHSH